MNQEDGIFGEEPEPGVKITRESMPKETALLRQLWSRCSQPFSVNDQITKNETPGITTLNTYNEDGYLIQEMITDQQGNTTVRGYRYKTETQRDPSGQEVNHTYLTSITISHPGKRQKAVVVTFDHLGNPTILSN